MPQSRLTGSRIRERRLALGTRQADLARAVGVSPAYLNLIEHNRRRIGGKLLVDLARELNTEPAQLSEGAGQALVERLGADARAEGFKIVPLCPFVNAQRRRHPDWSDVFQV